MRITPQELAKTIKKSTATVRQNKKARAVAKVAFESQERAAIKEAENQANGGWNFYTETYTKEGA